MEGGRREESDCTIARSDDSIWPGPCAATKSAQVLPARPIPCRLASVRHSASVAS
ncbi:hypothetical protein An08g07760 [Aspergillus niger]|uniref:Uncharacterized protein n=2 Tax=Aspergillus niger TaxID=5061 RepID=A2QRZ7_ASPNC|nr:hypothetical protein An08g07760 [Aspergillus niger]CAK40012.1 hypothetical protein An08g07760 [Aspergillus niger]